jgi:hypothetical protein
VSVWVLKGCCSQVASKMHVRLMGYEFSIPSVGVQRSRAGGSPSLLHRPRSCLLPPALPPTRRTPAPSGRLSAKNGKQGLWVVLLCDSGWITSLKMGTSPSVLGKSVVLGRL